ncbi:uncharacterized protein [Asterias amurensis]|uniref:uncharacterized protein n=1 Tax=Asterias amurensis TaxID=7602 RepID=UPI003AB8A7AD
MARRKKKGNSRKRPLVFTESPVEASRHYPSPVFSARNPVGAELVPVTEKLQSWVSPQLDPNAPYTPPRRQRRCRAACTLDPTQTQRREITRKDAACHYTSLQFMKKAADKRGKIATGGELTSSSDSSVTLTVYDLGSSSPTSNPLGLLSGRESKSAEKRRPRVGELGRTRAQRRRSRSETIHQTWNNPQRTNKDVDLPLEAGSIRSGQEENNQRKFHNTRHQIKESSSDNIDEDSDIFPSTGKNVVNSRRVLRTRFNVGNTHATDSAEQKSMKRSSLELRDSTSPEKNCRRRSMRQKLNASYSSDLDHGKKKSYWPKTKKSSSRGCVLAYDTPEADYGVGVSLRRRRNLLPTPAKNKLMMGL